MNTIEKKACELAIGDVIIAKQGGKRFEIVKMQAGAIGNGLPYLTLKNESGKENEHDTSFDSRSATYTVEVAAGSSKRPEPN